MKNVVTALGIGLVLVAVGATPGPARAQEPKEMTCTLVGGLCLASSLDPSRASNCTEYGLQKARAACPSAATACCV
jgi:hypothetical protein